MDSSHYPLAVRRPSVLCRQARRPRKQCHIWRSWKRLRPCASALRGQQLQLSRLEPAAPRCQPRLSASQPRGEGSSRVTATPSLLAREGALNRRHPKMRSRAALVVLLLPLPLIACPHRPRGVQMAPPPRHPLHHSRGLTTPWRLRPPATVRRHPCLTTTICHHRRHPLAVLVGRRRRRRLLRRNGREMLRGSRRLRLRRGIRVTPTIYRRHRRRKRGHPRSNTHRRRCCPKSAPRTPLD